MTIYTDLGAQAGIQTMIQHGVLPPGFSQESIKAEVQSYICRATQHPEWAAATDEQRVTGLRRMYQADQAAMFVCAAEKRCPSLERAEVERALKEGTVTLCGAIDWLLKNSCTQSP